MKSDPFLAVHLAALAAADGECSRFAGLPLNGHDDGGSPAETPIGLSSGMVLLVLQECLF